MENKDNKPEVEPIPFSKIYLAQQGDKEAMDYVWARSRPFVYWLSGQWKPAPNVGNRWYEHTDLIQVGYLGFREALERWKPVEGVEFIHYCAYWVKEYFRREIGISRSRRIEILKDTISLNQRSDGSETGLDNAGEDWIDFEEDPAALEAFEEVDDFDFSRSVREQVQKLEDPQKTVIVEYHFKGRMLKDIAKDLDVSNTSVGRFLQNGYRELRANKIIQVLYAEIRDPGPNPYEQIGLKAFKINRMSTPEWEYIVKEAFREDLVHIFNGEELH